MATLDMACIRCPVASKCPRQGSSPLLVSGGKRIHCRIIGNFGRTPVDPEILSGESRERSKRDGPCLTLAEVPSVEDGQVVWELTKVFSQPVVGSRESTTVVLGGQLSPKNPGS